mgnify:CR=1 FL=1
MKYVIKHTCFTLNFTNKFLLCESKRKKAESETQAEVRWRFRAFFYLLKMENYFLLTF